MSIIIQNPPFAQGPEGANLDTHRTPIPFAAGLTARHVNAGFLYGAQSPIVPPGVVPYPVLPGVSLYTTFRDWYYRIHVVPTSISLGNLSSDVTRSILVWNAFFVPVSLDNVALEGGDGITLLQPVIPPTTIGPLQTLDYQVQVSSDGPAGIDATITWTIDGVDYTVSITGRRSVLFPFPPNWSSDLLETLSWTTTVTKAWSGNEQRQQIAQKPRRTIEYALRNLRGDDARLLDSVLFGWSGRFYSMPLWHEESRLLTVGLAGATLITTDTTRMTIRVGSSIALYRDARTYEVFEVLSFTSTSIELRGELAGTWPAGSKVIPCAAVIPQDRLSTNRVLPGIAQSSVQMLIDPRSQLLRLDPGTVDYTYRGEEMYLHETDWGDSLAVPYEANRRDMDSGLGVIDVLRKGDYPQVSRSFSWMCKDKAAADKLRSFFARRRGRLQPVWMPSGTEDFRLVEAVDPVSPTITVANTDFVQLVWPSTLRRDIIIKLRNGQIFTRRILDVATSGSNSVLILDAGFGAAFGPADVRRISYLGFYRLSSDSITFNWKTNYVATVETSFVLTEPDA